MRNWTWKHIHCNIHKLINLDILYQLLEDVIMQLIDWIVILINNVVAKMCFKQFTKLKKKRKSIVKSTKFIQLNKRFHQISDIIDLKNFKSFNKIK